MFSRAAPETSREAAERMAGLPSAEQRRHVLLYLQSRGRRGAIAEEIQVALRLSGDSVRPRLLELLAEESVIRLTETRDTMKGRQARIWRVA